jgi:hypothetical protein
MNWIIQMSQRYILVCPALILTCFVMGCGGAAETLVPVEGKLIVDGKPLDGVVVTFIPESSKKNRRGGSGKTDSTGDFEVIDLDQNRPGLPVGKYTVAYSRMRLPDGSAAPPSDAGAPADPGKIQVETFPQHLLSPDAKLPANQVEISTEGNVNLQLSISTSLDPALMGPG